MIRNLCAACVVLSSLAAGPALTVDASTDRHHISPDVYGMANVDPVLAREVRLPLLRWGGDSTTRYNWQTDSTNAGDDWFFICGGKPHPVPGQTVDRLIAASRGYGGRALVTVPILDVVNASRDWDCSYPVSLFGPQQKVNPYLHPTVNGVRTDAGNGRSPDGKPLPPLTPEQILRTHRPNTSQFQQEFVRHLVGRFGTAAQGGVAAYELDNEPGGWSNTHRDVHPGPTGHDELVSRSLAYAAAVKDGDPSAAVVGPGDFVMHYQSDGKPGDGKAEHDGLGQGDYYLRSFRRYAEAHRGRRLLDYFDEHYYPFDQDGGTADTIIEATRSLWDPTYVERNWYGKWHGAKAVIPSLHKWVNAEYPGTKIAISEYGWGDPKKPNDALAEADVLGIFGRERVDLACLWTSPKAADAMADAFRLYRDYDGHGGTYGDTGVRSTSDDQAAVSVYAAVRSADGALTVVAINKTHGPLRSRVTVAGFKPAAITAFRFGGDQRGVTAVAPPAVAGDGFEAELAGKTATIYVLKPT